MSSRSIIESELNPLIANLSLPEYRHGPQGIGVLPANLREEANVDSLSALAAHCGMEPDTFWGEGRYSSGGMLSAMTDAGTITLVSELWRVLSFTRGTYSRNESNRTLTFNLTLARRAVANTRYPSQNTAVNWGGDDTVAMRHGITDQAYRDLERRSNNLESALLRQLVFPVYVELFSAVMGTTTKVMEYLLSLSVRLSFVSVAANHVEGKWLPHFVIETIDRVRDVAVRDLAQCNISLEGRIRHGEGYYLKSTSAGLQWGQGLVSRVVGPENEPRSLIIPDLSPTTDRDNPKFSDLLALSREENESDFVKKYFKVEVGYRKQYVAFVKHCSGLLDDRIAEVGPRLTNIDHNEKELTVFLKLHLSTKPDAMDIHSALMGLAAHRQSTVQDIVEGEDGKLSDEFFAQLLWSLAGFDLSQLHRVYIRFDDVIPFDDHVFNIAFLISDDSATNRAVTRTAGTIRTKRDSYSEVFELRPEILFPGDEKMKCLAALYKTSQDARLSIAALERQSILEMTDDTAKLVERLRPVVDELSELLSAEQSFDNLLERATKKAAQSGRPKRRLQFSK